MDTTTFLGSLKVCICWIAGYVERLLMRFLQIFQKVFSLRYVYRIFNFDSMNLLQIPWQDICNFDIDDFLPIIFLPFLWSVFG
jgi:hypothetical protein